MLASSAEKNTAPAPGPWRTSTNGRYWAVLDRDGNVVANVLGSPREANATLIANGPRLLKTAMDLWHANSAEGPDRDELLIASAWAELIDAIEAADGSRESPTVDIVGCTGDPGCFLPDGHLGDHSPASPQAGARWADLQSETEAIDGDQVL